MSASDPQREVFVNSARVGGDYSHSGFCQQGREDPSSAQRVLLWGHLGAQGQGKLSLGNAHFCPQLDDPYRLGSLTPLRPAIRMTSRQWVTRLPPLAGCQKHWHEGKWVHRLEREIWPYLLNLQTCILHDTVILQEFILQIYLHRCAMT